MKALFNEYYGGGMNTIVFQELREARGLAYNAFAAYVQPQYQDEPEYFFTHIITQNDKMMDCVNQFHQILDEIPQSEASFQIAKDALTKRLATQRTTKFGLINAWLRAQWLGIDYDVNQRIYEALPEAHTAGHCQLRAAADSQEAVPLRHPGRRARTRHGGPQALRANTTCQHGRIIRLLIFHG